MNGWRVMPAALIVAATAPVLPTSAQSASPISTSSIRAAAWSAWESLGGKLASGPAPVSWGVGRLDVFVRGTDDAIWDRWYDNNTWQWTNLGGFTTTDPSAAASSSSPGSGMIHVAERDVSQSLSVATYTGSWNGWVHCIGGQLAAEPADVSSGSNQQVFVEGTDHQLWHWSASGVNGCGGWQPLGGVVSAAPAAVAGDVFVRGADLHLWYWSAASGWLDAGGKLAGKPAAASGGGPPDAFVEGLDGALWHYSAGSGTWEKVGSRIIGTPSAVATNGAAQLDVFVEGTDRAVWHATSSGAGWQWEDLGGQVTAAPSVASWAAGRFDLFARMGDGALWHRFYQ